MIMMNGTVIMMVSRTPVSGTKTGTVFSSTTVTTSHHVVFSPTTCVSPPLASIAVAVAPPGATIVSHHWISRGNQKTAAVRLPLLRIRRCCSTRLFLFLFSDGSTPLLLVLFSFLVLTVQHSLCISPHYFLSSFYFLRVSTFLRRLCVRGGTGAGYERGGDFGRRWEAKR